MITLEQIFNETYSQVLNHVRRVVRHEHDSEDVASDVFVKIQKLMDKDSTRFDENKSSLSTWVHTVTNSVILDFFRTNHQDHYKAVSDFVDSDNASNENKSYYNFVAPENSRADQEVLTAELQERIEKAFYELKPEYRRVASMFFIHQYDYIEIADMLNIPLGSVKGTLSRARAMLQEALDGLYNFKAVNVQSTEA